MAYYDPSTIVPGTFVVSGKTITFTPAQAFENNAIYTIVVDGEITSADSVPLGQEHTFSFQSKLSPLYCDIDVVMDDINPWLSGISPDVVARYIYRSSVFADNMAIDAPMQLDQNTNTYYLTYEAKQFVRYDAVLNLINRIYFGKIDSGGDTVQLGDFSVKKRGSLTPDLQSAMKDFRIQRQLFYDGIMGQHKRRYSPSRVASKGGSLTNPMSSRNSWSTSSTSSNS